MNGIETLEQIKIFDKSLDVIIVSAIDRALEATSAIQKGAYDYITKPFDPDTILTRVDRALQKRYLEQEVSFLRSEMAQFSKHAQIISQSRQMQEVFQTINKVAGTSSSVLITGESGTGKELIARAIHTSSERVQKSFVALNCASIPSELIESELFGHEKGAFTGAHNRTPGKFEFANGGTLLLDEISSLKSEFQAQLLRVLQEQEFTRVGGHRVIKVDVRIIAATNTCRLNMDGRGAWRDNIFVERLWRTVKYEQVYLHAYDSVSEARRSIMRYFDWYNRSRPHSGLNRRTPDEVYCATLPALDLAA